MPYATTSELEVYYESHGEGRPVVFLHGGGGNHLAWWQQVPHFGERYQVITIDFPGYGLSRSKSGEYDNAQYSEAILAVLDHAGVDRAMLVSQSAGSYGSLKLAVTRPERVAGVVMASNLSPVGDEISELDDIGRAQVRNLPVKDFLLGKDFQEKEPDKVFLFFQIGSVNMTGPGRPTPSRNSVKNSIPVQRIRDAVKAGVHVTFIQGTADVMMHPPAYDRLRELLPEAEVLMVEGAPHSDYWENPARFNSVVDGILDRVYPPQG
jgi:pimeloyl-ACP methyl ester carboxylesterase